MNLNCKQVCFSGGDSVLVAAVPWWRDEAMAGVRSLISVCSRAQGWWCWVFHNSAADVNLEKQVFCAFRRQRDSLLLTERQTVFNRVAFTTDQVLLSFPSVSFKALVSKFMVIMFSVFPVAKEILSWLHFQRGKRRISLWWQTWHCVFAIASLLYRTQLRFPPLSSEVLWCVCFWDILVFLHKRFWMLPYTTTTKKDTFVFVLIDFVIVEQTL